MILKELNLISFGKFENKIFNLEEGLNIFYGENESGKTTIHNFIYGMFYGFLRPYVTRRYYTKEHEKYRPWNGNGYVGILKLIKDGKEYRIERDFDKGEVKIYDELTGKDITALIDRGEKIKVHLPGLYFFDFNSIVYKNTISIKQLGNRIESNLSKEVKDRLLNISTSLDDEISVKEAISYLDKELNSIGTEKAYTKPYGKALMQLEKLKEKRKLALEKQKEYNNTVAEINIIREKIESEEREIKSLESRLLKAQLLKEKRIYEEVLKLKEEIQDLDEELERLEPYSLLDFKDYTIGLKLENDIENLDGEIKSLKSKIQALELKLEKDIQNDDEEIIKGIKVDEFIKDVNYYEEIEEEKSNLILNSQKHRLEFLTTEFKDLERRTKDLKIRGYMFLLLALTSLALILVNPLIAFLAVPFLGFYMVIRGRTNQATKELEELRMGIKTIKNEERKRQERLDEIEKEQNKIIIKYACSSKLDLNRLYEEIRLIQINQSQRIEDRKNLKLELKDAKVLLEEKKVEREYKWKNLKEILYKNNFTALEEFKEGFDKNKKYEGLLLDRRAKAETIEKILGDTSLEELERRLSPYDESSFENVNNLDISKIEDDIKLREEILLKLRNTLARLEERVDNLNDEIKKLIEIEEKINRVEEEIDYYRNRIRSIEIAKSTIEGISREIHNQFAPEINRQVGKMMNFISNGKYELVKIRDDLNISIENPNTGEIIPIDSLSGGTIDQLYFALRFSIISSMKGKKLPLILDDCFIQYDEGRLTNILSFLGDMSKEKQIILFTCHQREKQILDRLGIKYNLISLG